MPIISNTTLSGAISVVARTEPVFGPPFSKSQLTLGPSGLARSFGSVSAVGGMATANLVPQRRWCG